MADRVAVLHCAPLGVPEPGLSRIGGAVAAHPQQRRVTIAGGVLSSSWVELGDVAVLGGVAARRRGAADAGQQASASAHVVQASSVARHALPYLARHLHTATAVGDAVWVFGGVAEGRYLGSLAVHRAAGDATCDFAAAVQSAARAGHTAVAYGGGVLVYGGWGVGEDGAGGGGALLPSLLHVAATAAGGARGFRAVAREFWGGGEQSGENRTAFLAAVEARQHALRADIVRSEARRRRTIANAARLMAAVVARATARRGSAAAARGDLEDLTSQEAAAREEIRFDAFRERLGVVACAYAEPEASSPARRPPAHVLTLTDGDATDQSIHAVEAVLRGELADDEAGQWSQLCRWQRLHAVACSGGCADVMELPPPRRRRSSRASLSRRLSAATSHAYDLSSDSGDDDWAAAADAEREIRVHLAAHEARVWEALTDDFAAGLLHTGARQLVRAEAAARSRLAARADTERHEVSVAFSKVRIALDACDTRRASAAAGECSEEATARVLIGSGVLPSPRAHHTAVLRPVGGGVAQMIVYGGVGWEQQGRSDGDVDGNAREPGEVDMEMEVKVPKVSAPRSGQRRKDAKAKAKKARPARAAAPAPAPLNDMWQLDLPTRQWRRVPVANAAAAPRLAGHTAAYAAAPDAMILVGGVGDGGAPLAGAYVYCFATCVLRAVQTPGAAAGALSRVLHCMAPYPPKLLKAGAAKAPAKHATPPRGRAKGTPAASPAPAAGPYTSPKYGCGKCAGDSRYDALPTPQGRGGSRGGSTPAKRPGSTGGKAKAVPGEGTRESVGAGLSTCMSTSLSRSAYVDYIKAAGIAEDDASWCGLLLLGGVQCRRTDTAAALGLAAPPLSRRVHVANWAPPQDVAVTVGLRRQSSAAARLFAAQTRAHSQNVSQARRRAAGTPQRAQQAVPVVASLRSLFQLSQKAVPSPAASPQADISDAGDASLPSRRAVGDAVGKVLAAKEALRVPKDVEGALRELVDDVWGALGDDALDEGVDWRTTDSDLTAVLASRGAPPDAPGDVATSSVTASAATAVLHSDASTPSIALSPPASPGAPPAPVPTAGGLLRQCWMSVYTALAKRRIRLSMVSEPAVDAPPAAAPTVASKRALQAAFKTEARLLPRKGVREKLRVLMQSLDDGGGEDGEDAISWGQLKQQLAEVVIASSCARLYHAGVRGQAERARKLRLMYQPPARPAAGKGRTEADICSAVVQRLVDVSPQERHRRAGARRALVEEMYPKAPRCYMDVRHFVERFYYMPLAAQAKFARLLEASYNTYSAGQKVLRLLDARCMARPPKRVLRADDVAVMYSTCSYPVVPCQPHRRPLSTTFPSEAVQAQEMKRLVSGERQAQGAAAMKALRKACQEIIRRMQREAPLLPRAERNKKKLQPIDAHNVKTALLTVLDHPGKRDELAPTRDFRWHRGDWLEPPTQRDVVALVSRVKEILGGTATRPDMLPAPVPGEFLTFQAPQVPTLLKSTKGPPPKTDPPAEALTVRGGGSRRASRAPDADAEPVIPGLGDWPRDPPAATPPTEPMAAATSPPFAFLHPADARRSVAFSVAAASPKAARRRSSVLATAPAPGFQLPGTSSPACAATPRTPRQEAGGNPFPARAQIVQHMGPAYGPPALGSAATGAPFPVLS